MQGTSFVSAVEDTLTRPYRENARYCEEFLESINRKLEDPLETGSKAKYEELKRRLIAHKELAMALTIGGSQTTID